MTGRLEATRDAAAQIEAGADFGGIVRQLPAKVVRAETIGDVVAAIGHARESGRPLVARGQGHSTGGQSQAAGGISLQLRGLRRVELDRKARTVRVGAGITWAELLPQLLAVGLTPPTLTDYLGLSVGGTLSVGGIGGQSFRHGAQTDQLERLRVVTGTGAIVECSADHEVELFDACRAGLGQCAVIVEAVLRLVPAPASALVAELQYPDLRTLLSDQERLVDDGRFDYLLGSILSCPVGGAGWAFKLEAVKYGGRDLLAGAGPALTDGLGATSATFRVMPFASHATRLDAMVARMKHDGGWTALHPWMDLFLPAPGAHELIAAALDWIDPSEIADGHLMTYPLARDAMATPLLGVPTTARSFLFDVLPNLRDASKLSDFQRRCRSFLALARRAGAGVYPVGYPLGTEDMQRADWRRQLGEARWSALAETQQRHNPRGLFAPNVAMRAGTGSFAE